MKILHTIADYLPETSSLIEVVSQISKLLIKKGHEVSIATTLNPNRLEDVILGAEVHEFEVYGNYEEGFMGETKAYQNFLVNNNFDLIVNFGVETWPTGLTLPLLTTLTAKKIFIPSSLPNWRRKEYQSYFQQFPKWLPFYDQHILFGSQTLVGRWMAPLQLQNTIVIPYGASETEFLSPKKVNIRRRFNIPENHFLILSKQADANAKHYEESMQLFSKAKISDSTLLVICKKKDLARLEKRARAINLGLKIRAKNQQIIVSTLKRPEIVSAFHAADLLLHPHAEETVFISIFEAAASKTPCLVADSNASKEILGWLQNGWGLPTQLKQNLYVVKPTESAKMLEDIRNDPQARHQMAEYGFHIWKQRFTWEFIAKEYEAVYKKILTPFS